ncbi:MAG: thioredoxin family protein [Akkermansiaceae bacterium]
MKTTTIASLALLLAAPLFAGGAGWMSDFEAAKKKAAAEKKDLLVDFTGSDWCGWCIKLNEEVFQHDPFKKGIADKFILVELDYPRDKSKLTEATIKQNEELQNTYQVKGFPTILLMDAKGLPYAQTGYQAGGPEKYVEHLDGLQTRRVERDRALAEAEKLEGVAKAKALVTALAGVPSNHHGQYSDLITQIEKLDPKDETGFVAKQKREAAKSKLESDLNIALRGGTPDKGLEAIDTFLAKYEPEGEEKQEALLMKANVYAMTQKFDQLDQLIEEVVAINPSSQTGKYAESLKPRIEAMRKQVEDAKKEGE